MLCAWPKRRSARLEFGPGEREISGLQFRRSLFVIENVKRGDVFTKSNVRSIRPADGMHPRHLNEVLGQSAACDIERGTPLQWDLVVR